MGEGAERSMMSRRERAALRSVLIAATAAAGRRETPAELAALVAEAPITALPAAASLHRVGGSVLRGLEGVAGVPDPVREELGGLRRWSLLHHLLICSALDRIGRAFGDAGLSWVVMKGPVVATLLYPDVGDRTYGDLDLLVDRRHFPRAVQMLEELGFRHAIHDWALAERMMAGEVTMTDDHVSVDLHWHLHYSTEDRRSFTVEPEAMLERRRFVMVAGSQVPTFDAVDTLLTLAFHAARSGGHRLIWLKDLERSLAVEGPDLGELVSRARSAGCAPPVGLMLRRTGALLGAAVPPDVVAALTPASLHALDAAITRLEPPVRLDEAPTVTRLATRSVRSSLWTTLADVPIRAGRLLRRRLAPPVPRENDDPAEKQAYLRAVATSLDR
jgi:hypothetical protein